MERDAALRALRSAIQLGLTSKANIAKELEIHPSQVSRIVAGKFRRMDGNALLVCKFAIFLQTKRVPQGVSSRLAFELEEKVTQIVSINPVAAEALLAMLEAFIEQWSLLSARQ